MDVKSISGIIEKNRDANVNCYCDKCNKDSPKIKTEIINSLPEILMVQLKRYGSREVNGIGYNYKLNNAIEPNKEIIINNTKFILKSIITHIGEATNEGHYTTSFIDGSGAYIKCDDTKVTKADPPMNGYIFFYEKEPQMECQSIIKETGNNMHKCRICAMHFPSRQRFMHHLRTHIGKNAYQCSYCEKAFTSNGSLLCHIRTHQRTHSEEKPYHCTQCDQTFVYKTYFLKPFKNSC